MSPLPPFSAHAPVARPTTALDQLPPATWATIVRVNSPAGDAGLLQRRLMELGFVPGERVQVLRRVLFGKGPLAVQVGGSTFAMRTFESSLIEVVPA